MDSHILLVKTWQRGFPSIELMPILDLIFNKYKYHLILIYMQMRYMLTLLWINPNNVMYHLIPKLSIAYESGYTEALKTNRSWPSG